jgi:hypothetical protein
MFLTLLQSRVTPPPPVVFGGGDDAPRRRQREFEDERRDRDELKSLINRLVEPAKESESAQVIASDDGVAVLPKGRDAFAIPIPPQFDAAEVTRMVSDALERIGVEVRKARNKAARARARMVLEQLMREQAMRVAKRRREEEWLLLMD